MKTKIFTLLVLLGANQAFSLKDEAIVKITSHRCGNGTSSFSGSGLLFERRNEIFVLTSEHVLLHSNQGICHEVENSSLGKKEAELVIADWGMGLSILKLKEKVTLSLPPFNYLMSALPQENTPVTAMGYAYHSHSLTKDNSARVLIPQSRRGLIPLVSELIEVFGGFVEYGMSGGPVVAHGTDTFVGVLSHQAIKLVASRPSEVTEIELGGPLSNNFFVIPATVAGPWVDSILKEPQTPHSHIIRDSQLQQQGNQNVVFTSGLAFELTNGSGSPPVGGGDGVGSVGGTVGEEPVGGADGVGRRRSGTSPVGGNESSKDNTLREVKISLENGNHVASWDFGSRKTWFEKVKRRLLRQEKVRVPYFIRYDSDRRSARRIFYRSLSEFFTLLQNPSLTPVTVVEGGVVTGSRNTEEIMREIRVRTQTHLTTYANLRTSLKSRSSLDADNVMNQLGLLGELLKSNDWEAIELNWFRGLRTENYEVGWRHLFNIDFDSTVEHIANLIRILELLEKLRID